MTDSDLQEIAEYRVEMVNRGMWGEMSDKQKVAAMRDVRLTITAQLMCGWMPRKGGYQKSQGLSHDRYSDRQAPTPGSKAR
jgi:hypothetical protein